MAHAAASAEMGLSSLKRASGGDDLAASGKQLVRGGRPPRRRCGYQAEKDGIHTTLRES